MKPWIAVDLDGTLAEYGRWQGADHIGPPIPLMVERVKRWLADGLDVRIFTARVGPQGDDAEHEPEWIAELIRRWAEEHIGVRLPVTNVKDYGMVELWDDRAVQVVKNTGEIVGGSL